MTFIKAMKFELIIMNITFFLNLFITIMEVPVV